MCVLHWSFLPLSFSLPPIPSLSLFVFWFLHFYVFIPPILCPGPIPPLSLLLSLSCCCSDLKDIQNNKHRYLIASENQRPGHFSTAPIGSLTASPSSGALCSQGGLQSVTSIQERIMSTPGGEEAIERLKVKKILWDEWCSNHTCVLQEFKKKKKRLSAICPLCFSDTSIDSVFVF